MSKVEINKTTLVAAYLIATSFVMGSMSAIGPYSCPGDHGWRHVGMTLFAGLIWPFGETALILGYTSHDTKCLDGSQFIGPPKVP